MKVEYVLFCSLAIFILKEYACMVAILLNYSQNLQENGCIFVRACLKKKLVCAARFGVLLRFNYR
jgi:hypothetical protein